MCVVFAETKWTTQWKNIVENPAIVHSPMVNGVHDRRHHLSTDGVSGPTVLPL